MNRKRILLMCTAITVVCLLLLMGYVGKRWGIPAVAEKAMEMKLSYYESIVSDIRAGKTEFFGLLDVTVGEEDIAFYESTIHNKRWVDEENTYEMRETYILYSPDDVCDIEEELRDDGFNYVVVEKMTPLRENWYEMQVAQYFHP